MNMNEKKALYAFGCPNREATVKRLRMAAALSPDPATKKLFRTLAVKLCKKMQTNGTAVSSATCG